MKKGELKNEFGCVDFLVLLIIWAIGAFFVFYYFQFIGFYIYAGITAYFIYLKVKTKIYGHKKEGNESKIKIDKNALILRMRNSSLVLNNPFRGILVLGAAGSGKSESVAVPLLQQFTERRYSGVVYDFKFPTLANDVEYFLKAKGSDLRHFYLDFNNPLASYRVNPLNRRYLPNTSYAREYAQAIISNLMKESIKKPDFWTRSATDLLTACIWYLKEEHPQFCDLPHVFAMITSNDEALLKTLQKNPQTAQMTISLFNAMQRGADNQVSGVIGSLQSAIAQINTPELMYIFSGDDFSLNVNDPANPIVLTVGSYPTLTSTFAPLCSLVITVATKLMNQPDKHPSFVLLDEAPTCFIPNIEVLPNTGRSNKVATVLMCQDLAQLTDGYGKEKADVLFASCNNHFYGRVASSVTAEILSKQFGKEDKIFIAENKSKSNTAWFKANEGRTEVLQERDIYKSSVFLNLNVGEFTGIAVDSNYKHFKGSFKMIERQRTTLNRPQNRGDIAGYYKQVRNDISIVLDEKKSSGGSDLFNGINL